MQHSRQRPKNTFSSCECVMVQNYLAAIWRETASGTFNSSQNRHFAVGRLWRNHCRVEAEFAIWVLYHKLGIGIGHLLPFNNKSIIKKNKKARLRHLCLSPLLAVCPSVGILWELKEESKRSSDDSSVTRMERSRSQQLVADGAAVWRERIERRKVETVCVHVDTT